MLVGPVVKNPKIFSEYFFKDLAEAEELLNQETEFENIAQVIWKNKHINPTIRGAFLRENAMTLLYGWRFGTILGGNI